MILRVPHRPASFSTCLLLSLLLVFPVLLPACTRPGAARSHRATPVPPPTEPALAPPRPAAYAALGASETFGVGARPRSKGYAYLIARAFHASHFVNTGIPGTTLNAGYQTELTRALSIRPSLTTVFFGVNDLRDGVKRGAFLRDLHDLVATLRQAHSQVLIIGVPDLSLVPAASRIPHLHANVTAWNVGMRRVAKQTGAGFLDLRSFARQLARHPKYIAPDGLHPSNAGHARLAQVILSEVRRTGLWSVH